MAGSATESAGTFYIQGSGADIWGTSDQFHFLYQQVTGDVDVIARVGSIVNVDAWSKAGVMIRSSLAPGASHAVALASAGKGLAFQRRRADGAISYHTAGSLSAPPQWTRLVRKGTTVTAYTSSDGRAWTTLGSDTIALGAVAYVGIAVTSHASALTTAVVSQVAVNRLSLPAGFATRDVGGPVPAGSALYRNGVYTVTGSGADIWGAHDEFRYVFRQVSGDVDIRARVTSVQYAHKWTKAGVMIRESLTDSSRHAMALVSAGMGYTFQRRPETGGMSVSSAGGAGQAPGWVRLVRTGTAIDAYRSVDGTTWTLMGTDTVAMGATVYVGLAVSSHVAGQLADGVFDKVSIIQQATTTNTPPAVSVTAPAAGATFTAPASMTVSASATDHDGQIARVDFLANNTLIGTDASAPFSMTWSNVPAGTYAVTAVAYDNGGASTESAPVSVPVMGTSGPGTWTVAFTASVDHAIVKRYVLEIFAGGANPATATPLAVSDLGKPTPNGVNEIAVDRTTFFNALAAGSYVSTVRAENADGFGRSTPVTFTR